MQMRNDALFVCGVVLLSDQAFFRHHSSNSDPFVGLILSPYDFRLPNLQSATTWFNVASPQTDPTPMFVEVEELMARDVGGATAGIPDDAPALLQAVRDLAPTFVRSCAVCVDPHEIWRDLMGVVSIRSKLEGSLLSRCVAGHWGVVVVPTPVSDGESLGGQLSSFGSGFLGKRVVALCMWVYSCSCLCPRVHDCVAVYDRVYQGP